MHRYASVCLKRLSMTYFRKVLKTEIICSGNTISYLEKKKVSIIFVEYSKEFQIF